MVKALKFGFAVGVVVAAFETVKNHAPGQSWVDAAKSGVLNPTTMGAAAAAAVASFVL